MAAGTHYNLTPAEEKNEFYRVDTGVRKSGPWRLNISNLIVGSFLPVFTPVYADLKTREVFPVINVKVVEAATDSATEFKIQKNSLAYVGMFLGTGTKGAKVASIDKSNKNHDVVTVEATVGAALKVGDILFESKTVAGTAKKHSANFVLFSRVKVETEPVLPTLLMQAYEVKEDKLILPIHEKDKETLTSRFQFEY
ncbi:MAG: head fiber protein [Oscillospiraceae bacterium]|nr:head fiber protein [Oscillospiraceae bacterium]